MRPRGEKQEVEGAGGGGLARVSVAADSEADRVPFCLCTPLPRKAPPDPCCLSVSPIL